MTPPTRRRFVQALGGTLAAGAALGCPSVPAAETPGNTGNTESHGDETDPGVADRAYWVSVARRLATPVLGALARRQLKATMPVEARHPDARRPYTHLEALGRLLCGLAPWLETGPDDGTAEAALRKRFADEARAGIDAATDPASPDLMNFNHGHQPLVDAAFLAQALLRAPHQLWEKLDPKARGNLTAALASTRTIKPFNNNWLLFSATIEAAMLRFGQTWKSQPITTALDRSMQWYVGDGTYGDGSHFHWDYYNSYVIQPMLLDVLDAAGDRDPAWAKLRPTVLRRARRYAAVQERLIAPDGSYPPIGRSLCYRCGAFQTLALMALQHQLPKATSPAQVRCALTAVMRRQLEAPGTFDDAGFLRVGFAGHQPGIADSYISTGSLYLCSAALLPLGLPAADAFWQGRADWTAKKAWAGQEVPSDHATD